MEIFNNPRSRRLFYLGFAIIVSVLYDFLVYRQAKGLGFVVFVAASLGGFILLVSVFRNLHSRWPLLFLVVVAVLTLDVFIYNNLFVTRVAPLVIYVLSLLIFILVPLRNAEKKSFNFRNVPLVRSIDLPFHNWGQILKDVFRSRVGRRSQIYKKIAYSLIIAFPLLLIFTFLFSQADSIFADGLGRAFNINWDVDATLVWRAFRIVAMSLYLGGIFYVLVGDDYKLRDGEKIPRRFDATVVEIVLSLINALFLVFVFIQIKYLFGSAEYVIANDLTYAEYARSGFFELVWVMIISALFLVATYRSFAHHGASKAVQFLKLVLIAQVLVIALSALRRMNVYQEAYGFTTLRLYVEWFIYASMFGFIVLAVAAVRNWQFRKFFYTILALGLIIFTIVSSVNVDRLIARKNIDRALSQGKPLDLNYLMGLSADAYPEIIEVLDKEVKMKYMSIEAAESMFAAREGDLHKRLRSWRQYNLGVLRTVNIFRWERAGRLPVLILP